ncbi:RicAFT regulatory complex protein RicA family protein [Staphylococcus canis]|uniref:Cell fate regulator YmcA, YheA/YmcA/DUF963 family (Controls sporulation, competence, biofilm development) n=1 Tax=Staphylococcus canis TaxID=2724942 RepID=A0ABS0T860_9STAP|nr:YlbF family regulator [Staphylococcus canis]MBI5974935.1 hypothetical protein [Staphylococcus canis]
MTYSREDILKAASNLSHRIQNLEMVQNYQNIETQIHKNARILNYMNQLKQSQKQSVNFQNYDKPNAYRRSEDKINSIRNKIDDIPIVTEFRASQEEVNDLLHLVIKTLSTGLQHHIEIEKKE